MNRLKSLIFTLVVFGFYLLSLPSFLKLTIPCLNLIPGQSYSDSTCQVKLALDRYLFLALIGFASTIFIVFFFDQTRNIKNLIFTSSVLALLIIVLFNFYIPQAESAVRKAPIILNTMHS